MIADLFLAYENFKHLNTLILKSEIEGKEPDRVSIRNLHFPSIILL
jgi:hypothetical protein